ncbi:hypothetical protein Dimus_005787 [Dionaea muscipula]
MGVATRSRDISIRKVRARSNSNESVKRSMDNANSQEKVKESQRGLSEEQSEKVHRGTRSKLGRVIRPESRSLSRSAVEAEGTSVQHYIKTEEFKAAMAWLNGLWYAAGFDICKLQVEDELVKAKQTRTISLDMLDRLDPKNKGRYVFPEVELFPEELIPKPKLAKRSPMEIMKDWARAEDAEMGLSAAASQPLRKGKGSKFTKTASVCTMKHARRHASRWILKCKIFRYRRSRCMMLHC